MILLFRWVSRIQLSFLWIVFQVYLVHKSILLYCDLLILRSSPDASNKVPGCNKLKNMNSTSQTIFIPSLIDRLIYLADDKLILGEVDIPKNWMKKLFFRQSNFKGAGGIVKSMLLPLHTHKRTFSPFQFRCAPSLALIPIN